MDARRHYIYDDKGVKANKQIRLDAFNKVSRELLSSVKPQISYIWNTDKIDAALAS